MKRGQLLIAAILLIVLAANVCLHEHYDPDCGVCSATHNVQAAVQPPALLQLNARLSAAAGTVEPEPLRGYERPAPAISSPRAPPA
ncbi:MAG: hypothetical protein ACM3ZB_11920 [bacterium]|jgi:hypothetical protein